MNTTTVFKFLNSSQWPSSSKGHDVRYALTSFLLIKILSKDESFLDWQHYLYRELLEPRGLRGNNWYIYHVIIELELRYAVNANSCWISLSDDRITNRVTTQTRHRLLIALALLSQDFRVVCMKDLSPKNIPFISMMGLPLPFASQRCS